MNAASILISGCLFHYERREKRACLSARPIVRDRIVMMVIVAIKMTKMTRHRASAQRTTEEGRRRRAARRSERRAESERRAASSGAPRPSERRGRAARRDNRHQHTSNTTLEFKLAL